MGLNTLQGYRNALQIKLRLLWRSDNSLRHDNNLGHNNNQHHNNNLWRKNRLCRTLAAILTLISASFSVSLSAAETALSQPVLQQLSKAQPTDFHSLDYWQNLYGEQLTFKVTRNGKPAGEYQVAFKGSQSDWQVESRMALDFKAFLFFSYRFRYLGVEHWQGDDMQHFTSRIDRNGELSETFLRRTQDANGLPFWRGGQREAKKAEPATESLEPLVNGVRNLALSNHYNQSIVRQTKLFNSLTGKLNQISLIREGREQVSDGRERVSTTRYRYTGELEDTWVWYADDKRWLRMRFIADDGSTIQLNCQRCYPR